jgi:hypothetical protein
MGGCVGGQGAGGKTGGLGVGCVVGGKGLGGHGTAGGLGASVVEVVGGFVLMGRPGHPGEGGCVGRGGIVWSGGCVGIGGGQFGGIGLGLGTALGFSSFPSSGMSVEGGVGRGGCVGRTVPGFVQHTPNICKSEQL